MSIVDRFLLKYRINYNQYPISPEKLLNSLNDSQYWTKEKMENYQLLQFNILLEKAKENTEYYNTLLRDVETPLSSIDEIKNISYLKKEVIKEHPQTLITKIKGYVKGVTSGSTGNPLWVYTSNMARSYRLAGRMRFYKWWDLDVYSDKSVLIWGRIAQKKKFSFRQLFRKRIDINVFSLNRESIFEYYKKIEAFKPKYIRGYKSAILLFAELMVERDLKFKKFNLKYAIVTSEVLFEDERKYIEKALGCKVINEYGAVESGLFGFECPEGSMHIFEEAVYSFTDNDGSFIVTELHNDKMPLINYAIGDKVVLSDKKCKCGRTLKVIEKIEGRLNDFVLKPDGTKLSQYLFYYIMKELDKIGFVNTVSKYLVIQDGLTFDIHIVPSPEYSIQVEEYIQKRIYEEIGNNIVINFHYSDELPREASGKLRFFIRKK